MQRRRFSREFKLKAVKLVGKRGVSSAMRASTHHQLFSLFFWLVRNWRLPQTDARSSTVLRDELDAGLFEGAGYCGHGIF